MPREYTDPERAEIIAAWRASGLALSTFTAQRGLPHSTVWRWIYKRPTIRLPAFAEIEFVPSEVAATPLVLQLAGSGHRVEVPPGFCSETLRRQLEVVA
jgi:hypothetical protein